MADSNQNRFKDRSTELIRAFEFKHRTMDEHRQQRLKRSTQRQREVRELMREAGFDVSRLDGLLERDSKALSQQLEETLPTLIKRSHTSETAARRKELLLSIDIPGRVLLEPAAATLMATRAELLEGNPVLERGNPWITSATPQILKLQAPNSGDGWGCPSGLSGPTNAPSQSIAYPLFGFVPPSSGVWNFMGVIGLHGYYVLMADDEWWNCKSSHVNLKLAMGVYQYFWQGWNWEALINEDHENVNGGWVYDSTELPQRQAILRAGDWTTIAMGVDLWSYAQGGGSYADLNFASGNANFIEPAGIIAWPS